ncbi:phosphatidylinositol phosphatase PTPRQ isoform X2 [Petromyzon marinus]|uniref:phosphatidylinositol phosphatase PTPRQ isoform X2 n=1 Tax=Petromyzon marinus TaxID=7757 RepID=UPI003F6EA21B
MEGVPEDGPSNVSYRSLGPTAVELRFSAPARPNGAVLYYAVAWTGPAAAPGGGGAERRSANVTAAPWALRGLRAHADYGVSVAAATARGPGPATGIAVRTEEDVPGSPPQAVSYRNVSPSTVEVSFLPPSLPNGEIALYSLYLWPARCGTGDGTTATDSTTASSATTNSANNNSASTNSANTNSANTNSASTATNSATTNSANNNSATTNSANTHNATTNSTNTNSANSATTNSANTNSASSAATTSANTNSANNTNSAATNINANSGTANSAATNSTTVISTNAYSGGGSGSGTGPTAASFLGFPGVAGAASAVTEGSGAGDPFISGATGPAALGNNSTAGAGLVVLNVTGLSHNVTGLEVYSHYWLQVAAWTLPGEGPRSTPMMLTTDQDVPASPPLDVTIVAVTANSASLVWRAPTRPNGIITQYTVYYGLSIPAEGSAQAVTPAEERSVAVPGPGVTLGGLHAFSRYRVTLGASTQRGEGLVRSAAVEFTTLPGVPEDPPRNVSYRALSATSVELRWAAPLHPNGALVLYTVHYRSNASAERTLNVTAFGAEGGSAVLEGLSHHARYAVWVTGSTALGDGGQRSDTLTIDTPEGVPGSAVLALSVVHLSPSLVRLSWLPPAEPNGAIAAYSVELRQAGPAYAGAGASAEPGAAAGADSAAMRRSAYSVGAPPLAVDGLLPFTAYAAAVTARTGAGPGPPASLAFVTSEGVPEDGVRDLRYANVTARSVNVTWSPPLRPNGRPLYRVALLGPFFGNGTNGGNGTAALSVGAGDAAGGLLLTGLRKYSRYELEVHVTTGQGHAANGSGVARIDILTDEDAPDSPPASPAARSVGPGALALSWAPPALPNGVVVAYEIAVAPADAAAPGGRRNLTVAGDAAGATVAGLAPSTAYNVSLAARTSRGSGPAVVFGAVTQEGEPSLPPHSPLLWNVSSTSAWVRWAPSPAPNGAVLLYGVTVTEDTGAARQSRTLNTTGADPWVELVGLRPFTNHSVSVAAFTAAGNGGLSSTPLAFTTAMAAPGPVLNLSCAASSWHEVSATWSAPAQPNGPLSGYRLSLAAAASAALAVERLVPPAGLSALWDRLPADTEVHVTVAAYNPAGLGSNRSCVARTEAEQVPGAPLPPQLLALGATWAALSWRAPALLPGRLARYSVSWELRSAACAGWEPAAACAEAAGGADALPAARTELRVDGLRPYRWYRFRVAAATGAGLGPASEWSAARTAVGAPGMAPVNVTAVAVAADAIMVSWGEPPTLAGPTFYLVQVSSGERNRSVDVRNETRRWARVDGLEPATRYAVWVAAYTDTPAAGLAGPPVSVLTPQAAPVDAPTLLAPELLADSVTRLRLAFSAPARPNDTALAYQVSVREVGGAAGGESGGGSSSSSSPAVVQNVTALAQSDRLQAEVLGLKGGRNYSLAVRAVNGAGPGPWSGERVVSTGIMAPPVPLGLPVVARRADGSRAVTADTVALAAPGCLFSDEHGPLAHIHTIVLEAGAVADEPLATWHEAYFGQRPRPYVATAEAVATACRAQRGWAQQGRAQRATEPVLVVGGDQTCRQKARTDQVCNGPLKPGRAYLFKFRGINILGQYTDSLYSERISTLGEGLPSSTVGVVIGVTLFVASLILLVLMVVFLTSRFRSRQKEGGAYSPRDAEILDTKLKLDQLFSLSEPETRDGAPSRPVPKKAFLLHVESLCANGNLKFIDEFTELSEYGQELSTSDADLPWNQSKNRFAAIKPYNDNRVKLSPDVSVPGSDYINASYISGYHCPNELVATQGPLAGTVGDFWRMVWETGASTIAMLTACVERGRIRCHQYWPEECTPVAVFGDIVITKITESVHPEWVTRELRVERLGESRCVHHLALSAWPEFAGADASAAIVRFVLAVRAARGRDAGPLVVHCSAGVGRTGVFVAVDHLVQLVADRDSIDVFGLVADLRHQRTGMVQNVAQYMFLHQCAVDLLTGGGKGSRTQWFLNHRALHKLDSLDGLEGDVELEWEETTM